MRAWVRPVSESSSTQSPHLLSHNTNQHKHNKHTTQITANTNHCQPTPPTAAHHHWHPLLTPTTAIYYWSHSQWLGAVMDGLNFFVPNELKSPKTNNRFLNWSTFPPKNIPEYLGTYSELVWREAADLVQVRESPH